MLVPQGVSECDGQELTSLPALPSLSGADLVSATTSLLTSLARLRGHLLFMRMDYDLSPGLPCQQVPVVQNLVRKYRR